MYVVLGCLSGFLFNLQQETLQVYYNYSFYVMNIIAAINSLIEFIAVMNYVKIITSDRFVAWNEMNRWAGIFSA